MPHYGGKVASRLHIPEVRERAIARWLPRSQTALPRS